MSFLALVIGLIVVFPILYGVLGSFKSDAEFFSVPPTLFPTSFAYTDNFEAVFRQIPVMRLFLNSLIVALMTASVRLFFAMLAAYAVAFYAFRFKNLLFLIVLGTMMLPADTLIVTNYQTVARMGLLNSYLGMSIVSFVGASQMFMLRQNFLSVPREMREASALDGCDDICFLVYVLAPMSRPILATLFVQGFINTWNAYLWPLLVTNHDLMRTIQVGITMLTTYEDTNYNQVLAGVTVSLIPALILFIFLRKNITRSMTAGALVG